MVNKDKTCEELVKIANNELEKIVKLLPEDGINQFVLFTELTRIMDHWGVSFSISPETSGILAPELDIIKMGWNIAVAYLFKPLKVNGFPILESTQDTRMQAINLLMAFGYTIFLKRVADMVKSDLLSCEKQGDEYVFSRNKIINSQFTDSMDLQYLQELEIKINNNNGYYENWNLVDKKDLPQALNWEGSFLSLNNENDFSAYELNELNTLMMPLIRPWDTGKGVMVGYDSTHEIDNHFLAKATELVGSWREEAGLHPDVVIEGVTAGEICLVVVFLVSFHIKHVQFVLLASKENASVSVPQSLTIWGFRRGLEEAIAEYLNYDLKIVSRIFDIITMSGSDAYFLKEYTSKFMPLLINIGNGIVLRPVSSVISNPFTSIIAMMENRNPKVADEISKFREGWMRDNNYAMFLGVRYQRVEGNINLRQDGMFITDIDAAIYDNTTGELALFQIKWQDFFYNDVKKLRSKASNLAKDLDKWTDKVTKWIDDNGHEALAKNLKIKVRKGKLISNIYLFGISKSLSRTQGYGFELKAKNIAIANWAQFVALRFEVGPAERVIHQMFENLKEQADHTVVTKPLPFTVALSGKKFVFNDLWNTVE